MQLYNYELIFFEDKTTNFELLENGLFKINKYVDLYWKEKERHPYILKSNDKIAGFVLERFNDEGMYEITEIFVINRYRKIGAGTFIANEMLKKYKGKWKIKTLLRNKRAQDFFRKLLKMLVMEFMKRI